MLDYTTLNPRRQYSGDDFSDLYLGGHWFESRNLKFDLSFKANMWTDMKQNLVN